MVDPVVDRDRAVDDEAGAFIGDGREGVAAGFGDVQVAAPADREVVAGAEPGRATRAPVEIDGRVGLLQGGAAGQVLVCEVSTLQALEGGAGGV